MFRRSIPTLLLCAVALIPAGSLLFAQTPPTPASSTAPQEPGLRPPFRGGVDLIQLVVTVLDNQRQPVRGLTAADFTVLDNGVVRPVRAFAPVEIPGTRPSAGTAAWTRDVAPDVATNQVGEQAGRLVVILMDRSIKHEGPTVTARRIATSIVDALGPNDLAALVSTSAGEPQVFTADRSRLIASINQRDWATDSDENPWTLDSALTDGRCLCGLCVLETVTRVAQSVRDAPNRARSLFFIGSGLVIQAGPSRRDPGCDHLVRVAREQMLDAIALSNLTIHSIDPNGLASVGPQTLASSRGGGPLPEGAAAAARRQQQQAETNELLRTQGTLRVLPDLTGGRTVVSTNAPETKVPEIFRESESYYVLGFEAAADARPDATRSIEVKVARRGVRVATRRQYVAPAAVALNAPVPSAGPAAPARTAPELALSGLLPDGAPPLTMSAAAFASLVGPDGVVSVNVDARGFMPDTESTIPLRVSVLAVDQTGRPVASAEQTSTIAGPRLLPAGSAPIDVGTLLTLPPGDYEVRVALTDISSGSTASVFSQVVVPAFATEQLSLSDIAIERGGTPPSSTTTPEASAVPTTERTFGRADQTQVFLQIYQGTERASPLVPISVEARVIDTQDRVISRSTETFAANTFRNRRANYRTPIPVQQLAAGEYLLRVVASAGTDTVTRAVRFTVQ
jgi:VWFA-related protein